MGERKGQNKYYPPDFDYRKHKSLDHYHGTHPLRERAKKLNQGILVIRFEMPYNIWCDGCGNHIGMGVRYNAEKSKVGNYYTTPIYKFRMKCHLCPNYIEIKTDPAAHDYVIISGARRKEQRWDPKENEQIVTDDKEMQKKLAQDAMYRLEHTAEDKVKQKAAQPGILQLTELREDRRDDYLLNKIARNKFRNEKKHLQALANDDDALLKKSSLDIKLVAENSDDVRMAKLLKYRTVASFDEKQKEKREGIVNRPIFSPSVLSPSPSNEGSLNERQKRLNKLAGKLGIQPKSSSFSQAFNPDSSTPKTITSEMPLNQLVKTSKPVLNSYEAEDVATKEGNKFSVEIPKKDSVDIAKEAAKTSIVNSRPALVGLGLDYDSSGSGSSDDNDGT